MCDGRSEVVVEDQVVDLLRRHAWTPDDERDPYGLLVGEALVYAAVLAEVVAVVGGEDDVGVIELVGVRSAAMRAPIMPSTDCREARRFL